MSSIEHHLTELYILIDDLLLSHPALAHGRQSPHDQPAFTDAEVLTIALLQGCLGVASLKQTYRLVAHNCRSAFPSLCSYQQWMARLQATHGSDQCFTVRHDAATERQRCLLPDRCQAITGVPSATAWPCPPAARGRCLLG